jgi:hypothetical protein
MRYPCPDCGTKDWMHRDKHGCPRSPLRDVIGNDVREARRELRKGYRIDDESGRTIKR